MNNWQVNIAILIILL